MIVQRGKKWLLYTKDGSRILGTHTTRKKAIAQEQAILISQQRRKNPTEILLFGFYEPELEESIRERGLDSEIQTISYSLPSVEKTPSVLGHDFFFSHPPLQQWDLKTLQFNLTEFLEDYPDTLLIGTELIPSLSDLTSEEIAHIFGSLDEYQSWRQRELTVDTIQRYTQRNPEDLWKGSPELNVPHLIVVPSAGLIPSQYLKI
tara:strand:+ start:373 stop:984 length:612 start_codon:yes stop_codon:yes gene_type:complete